MPDPRSPDPLVSVSLCVYNGERDVANAIEDILGQTYRNLELIISNDASTDGTAPIVDFYASDPRVRIIHQPRNLGFLANKNSAISQARGDFITQQDHDDRSAPTRIERQVAKLRRTGLDVCACGVRRVARNGQLIDLIAPPADTIVERGHAGLLPFFYPPTMFARRLWKRFGPFNPFFAGSFGEDNYFISCLLREEQIAVVADPLYDYVDVEGSVTSRADRPRALVMEDLLAHLDEQNQMTGTNDLERGDMEALAVMETSLLADRPRIAERLRTYAARAIDHRRSGEAARLLAKAAIRNPRSLALWRTAAYFARTMLRSK